MKKRRYTVEFKTEGLDAAGQSVGSFKKQLREETEEETLEDHERGHYIIDEKNRSIELTDDGYILVEAELEMLGVLTQADGLYSVSNLKIMRFFR